MLKQINANIKTAMREKNNEVKDILRLILGKAKDIAIAREEGQREVTSEDVKTAIQKQIKQNKETIVVLKDNARDFSKEENEIAILMEYLPKQMSTEDMNTLVRSIVDKIPEEDRIPRAKGTIMKELAPYRDTIDMKEAGNFASTFLK